MGIFSAKVSKTKMDLLATRRQEHISVSLSNQNGMVMAENRLAFSSITFLPGKTSYPTETTVCLMFSLSDQDTLPVTYHTPTGVFLFGEDGVQVSADTTVYEKQTDDSLPSLTSQDIEHLQEGGYPDTSDSPEAPDTESGSASVPSEDAKDTKKEVQP